MDKVGWKQLRDAIIVTCVPIGIALLMQRPDLRTSLVMKTTHWSKEFCQWNADLWQNLATQIRSQSSNTYPMYTNIIASMPNGSSTVDIGDTDINLSLSAIANQPGAFTVAFGRVDLAQLPGVRSPTNPDVFGFGLGPQ